MNDDNQQNRFDEHGCQGETCQRQDSQSRPAGPQLARRTVLGVGAAGMAGVALAACGSSAGSGASATAAASTQAGGSSTPTSSGAPAEPGQGSPAGPTSAVPVGGAAIVRAGDTGFVVAQPTAGNFVAHSAICPHQGCLCSSVEGMTAICPCHGSRFNAESGAVEKGPATTGLVAANVFVSGDQMTIS